MTDGTRSRKLSWKEKHASAEELNGSTRILRVSLFTFLYQSLNSWYLAFLGRDNVIEVALGLIIGAGFSNVVTSLVSDIILPPITLISPDARNLANRFFVLRGGETPDAVYNTREQAAADGKPLHTLNY
jgi:hypothetical protein